MRVKEKKQLKKAGHVLGVEKIQFEKKKINVIYLKQLF